MKTRLLGVLAALTIATPILGTAVTTSPRLTYAQTTEEVTEGCSPDPLPWRTFSDIGLCKPQKL